MVLVDNLSDAANQITSLQLADGTVATLQLIFQGTIQRWIYNVTHSAFPNGALNGQMACIHPNILRQWKNIIPFGLSFVSTTGNGPVSVQDFANGTVLVYILDKTDVAAVEKSFFGANS